MGARSLLLVPLVLVAVAAALVPSGEAAPVAIARSGAAVADCTAPRTWDVAALDPRDHITRAAFIALIRRSERIWEAPSGLDLLRYAPGGDIRISLVFDQRQVAQNQLNALDRVIDRQRAALAAERTAMARRSAVIKARKAKYDAEIALWNAKGGAPAAAIDRLAAERTAIGALVDAANAKVDVFNTAVHDFNQRVVERNLASRRRAAGGELGEAEVGGTKLQIFVLSGSAATDETLVAHELGHILGLGHIAGVANVMNPVLVKPLASASAADLAALRRICAAG